MCYLWLKALHLVAMVAWFAGLFYMPRLFVYHTMATEPPEYTRFCTMERKLYLGITTPSGVITVGLGLWLLCLNPAYYLHSPWMIAKLVTVALLILFHGYCGYYGWCFKHRKNGHSAKFYRWFNEIPTLLLLTIVCLVVVKPSFGS